MIRRIGSDLASFKTLTFRPGLNILLADKSLGATDRQSRNGAGKTSLIELIHFLLGGNADADSIFRSDALIASSFEADLDVGAAPVTVARLGSKPSRIRVQGDCSGFVEDPKLEKETGDQTYSQKQWVAVLGAAMFGLASSDDDLDKPKYGPSFRSLFSYFARRQTSGGFIAPERQNEKQQAWDQQVNLSYLLDLDPVIPGQFEALRQREAAVKDLKQMAKAGTLGGLLGTAADFRTRLTIAENHAQRLRQEIAEFRVVPEYEELEREASRLTREIRSVTDANVEDRILIDQLRAALGSEKPPDADTLTRLYTEAGVVLSESVRRRFDEVAAFHETVVVNRRAHLAGEIDAATARMQERERQKVALDRRRGEAMGILRSGGALDHFTKLQEEVGRAEGEVQTLRQKLELAEQIETTKAELDLERAQLTKALQNDHRERETRIKQAILLFEELSSQLYERAGNLYIGPGRNGPEIDIKIEAARSQGIRNMQIYCFDMMLSELVARRGIGPRFLVHDSHLFDGVDERQVAKALQIGAERSKAAGFQYIVTMNSDAIPTEGFQGEFHLNDFVLPVKLTDAHETGGLFGVRFG